MQNFEYYNRTKIIFGKGTEEQVGSETAKYAGSGTPLRILLHHPRRGGRLGD
jgi:alcohol dehydrogenase YqhD (iron-dependent ADH family)